MSKKKVLSDHKQVGKKFIPPAKQLIPGLTEVHYIERLLPEIVWIGFFLRQLGPIDGISAALKFGKACWEEKQTELRGYPLLSSFTALLPENWNRMSERLKADGIYGNAQKALLPLVHCYPASNPFASFCPPVAGTRPQTDEIKIASAVVHDLFDRRSQEASVAQAVVQGLRHETRKLKYSSNVPLPDLNVIVDKFGSPEAERACAHVRMHLNSLGMLFQMDISAEWARYFWNQGKELIPLKPHLEIPDIPADGDMHPMQRFALKFERHCLSSLAEIWSKLPIDLFDSETYEVLGALLSRQCNLAVKLARNPDLWDWHMGPIFLRAMTDTYITIAWILKEPLNRARMFISHGLGQEKLQVEHLKSELENLADANDKQDMSEHIQARQGWIDAQHYGFLQEVNVGSWSEISTRQMADEAGCSDLYRFAYTPWSHAAHSMWNHIAKFDSTPSPEPLHKHIQQPLSIDWGSEFDLVVNATKYLDKAFAAVKEKFKLNLETVLPYEWLMNEVHAMQPPSDDSSASK